MIDKDVEFEFCCSRCGSASGRTIRDIEAQPRFFCGGCGSPIDATRVATELQKADRGHGRFERRLRNALLDFRPPTEANPAGNPAGTGPEFTAS